MTFTYSEPTVTMATDDRSVQIVFVINEKDSLRFKTAMHTTEGLQVETFNVEHLRVLIRKNNGVRILQEDHPTEWGKGW